MAKITDEDILKLAKLSNFSITDQQVAKFRDDMQAILEYVEKLNEVDVSGLEPTDQVTGLVNVMRDDEVKEYQTTEELLKNVPDRQGDLIKVKRVIE